MLKLLVTLPWAALMQLTSAAVDPFPNGATNSDVKPAFIKNDIVPYVFDIAPDVLVKVTFPPDMAVKLGNTISAVVALQEPAVSWPANDELYTLVAYDTAKDRKFVPIHTVVGTLTALERQNILAFHSGTGCNSSGFIADPNYPDNDLATGFFDWIVVDIPNDKVAAGETVMGYVQAPALPGTGGTKLDIFFVFKQSFEIGMSILTSVNTFTNVKQFASDYNLTIYAGNFFYMAGV